MFPSLSFSLWIRSLLEGIANTIVRFVAVEDDFMLTYDKCMAKILVEMDISEGLLAEVEILCQDRLLFQ